MQVFQKANLFLLHNEYYKKPQRFHVNIYVHNACA